MTVTLSDLEDLKLGARDPIIIGVLPDEIRTQLGLRVANVYLSKTSYEHIVTKHKPNRFELLIAPFAIRDGLILREKNKSHVLISAYEDPTSHLRYCAAMKIANESCEVWLTSFYRTKERQTRSMIRRCHVLRKHK